MNVLNSATTWGILATAGVAVPIIIHLLYRKHRRQVEWAAMELLNRALVTRSGQVKIEDWLILALRCLAILLIAAALLRPVLSGNAAWVGDRRVGVVIAVDGSYSMNHGGLAETRHEDAMKRVREILDTLQVGDPVTLVQMSDRPVVHFRGTGYNPEQFNEILETIEPSSLGLSLDKNMESLKEFVAELKSPVKEVYVITDAQEGDWGNLSNTSQGVITTLTEDANVYVIPTRKASEDNLSIRKLDYASGSLTDGGMARFIAEVRNEGRKATGGGVATFFLGDQKVSKRALGPLDPGQTRSLSFFAPFNNAGDVALTAKLTGQDDGLKIDNVRHAVVKVRPAIQVLCVDNVRDVNEDTKYQGSFFLQKALRLKGGEDERIQVTRTFWQDMPRSGLADFDVIIFANVPEVDLDLAAKLRRYTEGGGGLVFFMGEDVDLALYNKRLGEGPGDVLPAKLAQVSRVADRGKPWTISANQSAHPLAALIQRLPQEVTATAGIRSLVTTEPRAEGESIISVPAANAPLLSRRALGRGSVLLFTTTADREWSNLAVHPLYLMLLRQAITNITSRPDSHKIITGQTTVIPVPGRKIGETLEVSGPEDAVIKVQVSQAEGEPVIEFTADDVGIYEIPATDQAPALTLAANVDPLEANVRVVDAGVVKTALQATNASIIDDVASFAKIITEGRQGREIAAWLLYLGIFVFILQSVLAKFYSERMSGKEENVSGSVQMGRIRSARRS